MVPAQAAAAAASSSSSSSGLGSQNSARGPRSPRPLSPAYQRPASRPRGSASANGRLPFPLRPTVSAPSPACLSVSRRPQRPEGARPGPAERLFPPRWRGPPVGSPQWRRWCGWWGEPCWAGPRPCCGPSGALAAVRRAGGPCGPASPCRSPPPWRGSPGPCASRSPRSPSRWIGGRKNGPCSGSTTTWGSWATSRSTRRTSSWGPSGCEAGGGTSCRGASARSRWWEIGCL